MRVITCIADWRCDEKVVNYDKRSKKHGCAIEVSKKE